ncbi:MAG: iron(III) transport system substrate-binding protein [Thermoplasmata archaeon]|jgi:ABC-type molybdate transport system substrate-binding protein|nr:iron(III) transport system substrate-binding protein [Thermoplasmata archaeon]
MKASASAILLVVLAVGAVAAAADLHRVQAQTLVVYTTPALKDVLEKDIIPRYEQATGERVDPVYVPAGEQYNRLRMGGDRPEADVFLHASPLYLEQGSHEGYFDAWSLPEGAQINATYRSDDPGATWYAFAWSPLVEVYGPRLGAAPDLATAELKFGLAHPLLSNNGIYNVIYYEQVSPEAGRHALARTTVQPTNSRATIDGVADGSFDVTLGYEAVALLYEGKGARVEHDLPLLAGNRSLVPVLFVGGLVHGHPHADAERFLQFLFTNQTQGHLAKYFLRPTLPGAKPLASGLDAQMAGLAPITYDWTRWQELEAKLPTYRVKT